MSLNQPPTLEYDPDTDGLYVVIRCDAGYWVTGTTFTAEISGAAHVAVDEGDIAGLYRADVGDLAGLPAGSYELDGFRPPEAGETGDQYIGRDPGWRWTGTTGGPIEVDPPADPAYATGYLLDQTPGTIFTFRRTAGPGTAGYGWSEATWDVTADGDGVVEYAFAKGHTYEGRRASGETETFTVPTDADTFALPEMLSEAP